MQTTVPSTGSLEYLPAFKAGLSEIAQRLVDGGGGSDPYAFAHGEWSIGSNVCFRCTAGPALVAAVSGILTNNASQVKVARTFFDEAIALHQQADGSFEPFPASEGGADIQTALFANTVGEAYLLLGDRLEAREKAAWTGALKRAAAFLIEKNDLNFYTNGNIILADTLAMVLTYKITGEANYLRLSRSALAFAVAPPQDRWPGYGLKIVKQSTQADGSDGIGYFTERGAGGLGFDADYVQAQLNVTTWWFLLTGDDEARKLTNMLYNSLRSRVNSESWTLDTSGGTRHPQANRRIGFNTPAVAVLSNLAGRRDVLPIRDAQAMSVLNNYRNALGYVNPGMAWGFGSDLACLGFALFKS